jgi:hypothetical protein
VAGLYHCGVLNYLTFNRRKPPHSSLQKWLSANFTSKQLSSIQRLTLFTKSDRQVIAGAWHILCFWFIVAAVTQCG